MKINLFAPILFVLLASGCASTAETRSSTPTATFKSAIAAKPVAKCILEKLEPMFRMASVQYRETATGASVWVEMAVSLGKDTAVVIDVDDSAQGSVTKFYSRVLTSDAKYRNTIEACI